MGHGQNPRYADARKGKAWVAQKHHKATTSRKQRHTHLHEDGKGFINHLHLMSSGHHISMEHRQRRNTDTNASREHIWKELQKKKKLFLRTKQKMENEKNVKHESGVTLKWATLNLPLSSVTQTSYFHKGKPSFLQQELCYFFFFGSGVCSDD